MWLILTLAVHYARWCWGQQWASHVWGVGQALITWTVRALMGRPRGCGSSEEGLSRTERRGLGSDWVCPLHLGGEQYSKALQLWILMNFLELACVSLVA